MVCPALPLTGALTPPCTGLFFIMQRRFMRPLSIGLSLIFFQQVHSPSRACHASHFCVRYTFSPPLKTSVENMREQITGQPSVLYYAGEMFQRAGLRMGQQSAGIAGILGAFKLLMTGAQPTCLLPMLRSGHRQSLPSACSRLQWPAGPWAEVLQ